MKILLVNDDGVEAVGLRLMVRALRGLGELYVVAPHSQQSAIGHGITIHDPIRLHERPGLFGDAVRGVWSLEAKPADCVKFALYALKLDIDLVVSGVNDGPNLGTDIVYSGTLAGASEGVICGKPAVAVSSDFGFFDSAERGLAPLMHRIVTSGALSAGNVINVNFPAKAFPEPLGMRLTGMGERPFLHDFVEEDGVYWSRGGWGKGNNPPGTDVWAFENGYISITPIQINRTNEAYLEVLARKLPEASR